MVPYNTNYSDVYNNKLKKYLAGGVHYNFHTPDKQKAIHFAKGKGSRLWDIDGNEYLDFYAKSGALILGHNNRQYNDALEQQIENVLAVDNCDIDYEVCSLISKYVPSAEMVRFGLSGTEIVQNALRIARAYTKKNKFLRFEGNFNGNADNIMGGKVDDLSNPVPLDCAGGLTSTEGRAKDILSSQSYLIPWNDIEILESTIEKYGEDIAAVITEPISMNGGSIMPVPGYLKKMRELCDRHNIVLIFDEIITGFRVGLGGAQALFGVVPDITTLGKCIAGGGIPCSAIAGKREIMKLYENRNVIHAGTFNGYPLGMAAIKANIEILSSDEGKCYKEMERYSVQVHEIIVDAAKSVNLPLVIQGHPACASFHCKENIVSNYRELNYRLQAKNMIIKNALASYGILISPLSRIYTNISLNISDIDFLRDRAVYALGDAKRTIDKVFG